MCFLFELRCCFVSTVVMFILLFVCVSLCWIVFVCDFKKHDGGCIFLFVVFNGFIPSVFVAVEFMLCVFDLEIFSLWSYYLR